jgi:hypothetical protein
MGRFKAKVLLFACDLVELIANQCSPVDIILKAQARIADITGVKDLLDYTLYYSIYTIARSPSKG